MTLILSAGRAEYVIQVSDRRLTSYVKGQYSPVDESAGKSLLLKMTNADYLIGYTGLARIQGEPTLHHLAVCFERAWQQHDNPDTIWVLFRRELRKLFGSPAVQMFKPEDRRLSIMASGHIYDDERRYSSPRLAMMSNFQDWGDRDNPVAGEGFNFSTYAPRDEVPLSEVTTVQAVGAIRVVNEAERQELRRLLLKNVSPHHVKNVMRGYFVSFAKRSPTIGNGLNATILYPGGTVDVDGFAFCKGEEFGTRVLDLTGTTAVHYEYVPDYMISDRTGYVSDEEIETLKWGIVS